MIYLDYCLTLSASAADGCKISTFLSHIQAIFVTLSTVGFTSREYALQTHHTTCLIN